MNAIQAMLAQKRKLTPKVGFNLVGLDDFELPGDQLFLISHHTTEADAKKAQKVYAKTNAGIKTFIYGLHFKSENVSDRMLELISDLPKPSQSK